MAHFVKFDNAFEQTAAVAFSATPGRKKGRWLNFRLAAEVWAEWATKKRKQSFKATPLFYS